MTNTDYRFPRASTLRAEARRLQAIARAKASRRQTLASAQARSITPSRSQTISFFWS